MSREPGWSMHRSEMSRWERVLEVLNEYSVVMNIAAIFISLIALLMVLAASIAR